jgi:carbon-monoxide dehydrogenase medium subunit
LPSSERIGALKPAPFDYHRPTSLAETFELLERYGDDGRILAGGQSLVPTLNMRLATPRAVIDINHLPGLNEIRVTPNGLVIGALVRHDEVERSPVLRERAPLIAAAMPHVGHAAIRARGTFGGSLALADPAAELPACVVALDATIRVASRRGTRDIAAADFFQGVYTTALAPGEVIVEIIIPPGDGTWRDGFDELARRYGDFALAGLAARVRVDGRALPDARLVFFGVGNTPVRAHQAEAALKESGNVRTAHRALAAELDPPGDIHGSPELRRHLAGVMLERVVGTLLERSK